MLRTVPRFARLRNDIRAGLYGDILYLEADYLWGRVEKLLRGWRGAMAFYSLIQGAAVHMIDLAVWLTGALPVRCRPWEVTWPPGARCGAPTTPVVLLLRFQSGLMVKVAALAASVHPHFHRPGRIRVPQELHPGILGGEGVHQRVAGGRPEDVSDEYPGRTRDK